MGIHLLENTVQKYPWGSPTAIPGLLGEPNPSGDPCAELWIGAHERAPSLVVDGPTKTPLDRLIAEDPNRWLGHRIAERFGRLPYLLKVLAAAEPLSIQCHPSIARAQAGFAREEAAGLPRHARERRYRDDNHKPELMCALSSFSALKGFKSPETIAADLGQLALSGLTEAVERFVQDRDILRLYRFVMTRGEAEQQSLATEAAARARTLEGDSFQWIVRLADIYPGDVGVLTPAFLNLVELSRDEAIFLGEGELHAYLGGVGVELMANSDNVIRGGLTSKYVDVPELLEIIDVTPRPPEILEARRVAPGERVFDTPVPDFRMSVIDLSADTPHTHTTDEGVELVLVADGHATFVPEGGAAVVANRGRAVVVAGSVRGYRVEGSARLYRASVPVE